MPKTIATWLLICCALVFAMVVVGGVTRLTHSGLSIVEWKPIVGTIPRLIKVTGKRYLRNIIKHPSIKKLIQE